MRIVFFSILIFQVVLSESHASCLSISNFPPEHLNAADGLYTGKIIYQSSSIFETEDFISYILNVEISRGRAGSESVIKKIVYNAPKYSDDKINELDKEKRYHIGLMTKLPSNRNSILNPFNLLPNDHKLAKLPHVVSVKCAKPYILEGDEWADAHEELVYRHSNGTRF
ncbi:hypothetical protein [Roseibium sediminis]|uniref:hypothetical protein n=1 Tax=Roseibium sediminis TaxID=1775174 RepID=UPI00123CFBE2|nr:hypothetical protein [Roseibium sediminis]